MHAYKVLSDSIYFDIHVIAEGVYAAVGREGAGAMANAGIVDLGDISLVFDTFLTYTAAADLRRVAEELTGRPVLGVVNSHWHGDHVQGNQAFPGTAIFASERTMQLIRDLVAAPDAALNRAGLEEYTRQLAEQVSQETDARKIAGLRSDLADFQRYLQVFDSTRVVLPNVLVSERLVVHGSRRSAELLCFGAGHTESDLFLFLPDDRVVFAGDLVPVRNHPWLGHGNPDAWLTGLERILQLDPRIVIPGHGLPGTAEDVVSTQVYIREVKALAAELAARGAGDAEIAAAPIPALAREWGAAHMFAENLRFLRDSVLGAAQR